MSDEAEETDRAEFELCLDALTERGWIASWARSGDRYAIEWTPIGRQRAEWLRTIDAELDANQHAMTYVFAAAVMFGPHKGDDPTP